MPMRQPKRREAQLWLEQFNLHLMEWVNSSRTEEQHLRKAVIALRSMMEREPEVAETVSNLCATLLHQHSEVLRPDVIDDMARLGLDAEQMRSDDHPLRWGERAILQVALARAANAQNRRFDALHALRAIKLPSYNDSSPAGCLRRYVGSKVDSELAELFEAGLNREEAGERARSALDACDWLTTPERHLGALLRGLTDLFYGEFQLPEEIVKAVLHATWDDLSIIEIHNAVRLTRCTITKGATSSQAVTALIERTLERIAKRGVAGLTPLDFVAFFWKASEKLCRTIIRTVRDTAKAVQVDSKIFDSLLSAAAAAYGECTPNTRRTYLESAVRLKSTDAPLIRTVGLGLLVVAETRADGREPAHAGAFLRALDDLVLRDDATAIDWRIRAEFDEPVGILVKAAARRLAEDPGKADNRIRLAHLLDSLRAASSQALAWLALVPKGTAPSRLKRARHCADDLFGRLVFALRSWPKAVAIILQVTGGRVELVCVSGKGLKVFEAGARFRKAAAAAAECVAEQTDLACDLCVPPDDEAVRSAGRAAFDALPAGVRKLVSESKVVLFCPDFRADADAIPFESFYSGEEWLGIAKVVSRVPSLEAMVRTAEGSRRRVLEKRLLSVAITEAEGEPLPAAQEEVASVRARLNAAGWDAPKILESRVDPEFILNRTPFAAHMHIAAHGEVGGTDEALILPRGARLTPENVMDGSYGCTPTVWLNTCELGQSRYLGGGVVRGVAQAFLEAGAPAVIANLLPVDDRESSRLAQRFYVHAGENDFGESLRRARRDAASDHISPVLWGSTVLMGDPRVTLDPNSVAPADWQHALVQAIARRHDQALLNTLTVSLQRESRGNTDDLRLACAAEIVSALREACAHSRHDNPAMLAEICRICIRMQALDAAALAAYTLSELTRDEDPLVALLITEGAIGLLRPVEALRPEWSDLTNHLLVRAEQLRRGDRKLRTNVHAPEGASPAEVEETRVLGQTIMETKLAIQLRSRWYGLSPAPRPTESSTEDILWNAVMASQSKSFEDMPETVAYSQHIASKLARRGELPQEKVTLAVTMFAGLLKWMWDGQDLVAVEKELIEGQTRVARLALASLLVNWSPEARWMELVSDYAKKIGKWLGALDPLPYDDKLYVEMDKAIKRIRDDGLSRLQQVRATFPDRVPDAVTFLMGTLIETNTYSYTEGSVPEDICEKLKGVHHELSIQAEGCLMPWLMEGFRDARESTLDELQRWCFGIASDAAQPAQMPGHPPT